MTANVNSRVAVIKNLNHEEQIAFAAVYEPDVLDTHGEYMDAADIQKMAHRFIQKGDLTKVIDTMHDNEPTTCYPVESYIAKAGDPDYTEGTWVMGVHVPDKRTWDKIKRGELNGFSVEAMVYKKAKVVELTVSRDHIGETMPHGDHTHLFYVECDEEGRIVAGRTTTDAGHSHEIKAGTATEPTLGHSHRFSV